ncbi:MAG: hypothetical protein ACRCW3_02780, partial [Metamycoplasmataceae bacterium]
MPILKDIHFTKFNWANWQFCINAASQHKIVTDLKNLYSVFEMTREVKANMQALCFTIQQGTRVIGPHLSKVRTPNF